MQVKPDRSEAEGLLVRLDPLRDADLLLDEVVGSFASRSGRGA